MSLHDERPAGLDGVVRPCSTRGPRQEPDARAYDFPIVEMGVGQLRYRWARILGARRQFEMCSSLGLVVLMAWVFLAACAPAPPPGVPTATPAAAAGVLVVGDISDEAAETIVGTQPLADYLAGRLNRFGIGRAEVRIAADLDTMIGLIAAGEVDLYFDSPYPALVVSQETGALPILRRWRFGESEYYSLFFARADSGLTESNDLAGQMIAFEEAFSTSGYMLPLAYLIQHGFSVVEKPAPEAPVAADEVGYVFSTADNTTIQWVISGRVPVGVVDNITYRRLIPEETRQELVILAETESIPRQMALVRAGMDPELVSAIKSELLGMTENAAGRAALETFQTTQFDEFPEGAEAALARMSAIYRLVQER